MRHLLIPCSGLGHDFLRHIERTKALAFVVDLSAGASEGLQSQKGKRHPTGADLPPWEAVELLRHELALYDSELPVAPAIVVANKVDRLRDAETQLRKLRCNGVPAPCLVSSVQDVLSTHA